MVTAAKSSGRRRWEEEENETDQVGWAIEFALDSILKLREMVLCPGQSYQGLL